jgi:hypothetical protein
MKKVRKMLGKADSPYILSLMNLIETQSKATIVHWSLDYVEKYIMPIYEESYSDDQRLQNAIQAARDWMEGKIKLPEAKKMILDAHAAAREAEENPAAQAAARAVGQAASTIHMPTHSLGIAFYGAAAVAYHRVGIEEKYEVYDHIASEVCGKMEAVLRAVAVENEPNPAKINWYC